MKQQQQASLTIQPQLLSLHPPFDILTSKRIIGIFSGCAPQVNHRRLFSFFFISFFVSLEENIYIFCRTEPPYLPSYLPTYLRCCLVFATHARFFLFHVCRAKISMMHSESHDLVVAGDMVGNLFSWKVGEVAGANTDEGEAPAHYGFGPSFQTKRYTPTYDTKYTTASW